MELDSQQLCTDAVTAELAKELQNGRLLRLLVKLSTVTERPEHDGQPQWSETGVRQAGGRGALGLRAQGRGWGTVPSATRRTGGRGARGL